MIDLLLITDVARLITAFSQLAEDSSVRLRIANTLETGGEELSRERSDVVFVQTHLSGLSDDILLMHLQKTIVGEQPRFILLAPPQQVNDKSLQKYHGWLDTSFSNDVLVPKLLELLSELRGGAAQRQSPHSTIIESRRDREYSSDGAMPDSRALSASEPAGFGVTGAAHGEKVVLSSDRRNVTDDGTHYPSRNRLSVYSEFNSSFDEAVSSTPEPEAVAQMVTAGNANNLSERVSISHPRKKRSKFYSFLLWLLPVVLIVVVVTYIQEKKMLPKEVEKAPTGKTGEPKNAILKPQSSTSVSHKQLSSATIAQRSVQQRITSTSKPRSVSPPVQRAISAKAPSTTNNVRPPAVAETTIARLTKLPTLGPRAKIDKTYSISHPDWERYVARDVEYRIFRENSSIKAIQVIARGGINISKGFLDGIFRLIGENTAFTLESSTPEKGFKVERGRLAENVHVVNYREEANGGLKAFVITWR